MNLPGVVDLSEPNFSALVFQITLALKPTSFPSNEDTHLTLFVAKLRTLSDKVFGEYLQDSQRAKKVPDALLKKAQVALRLIEVIFDHALFQMMFPMQNMQD